MTFATRKPGGTWADGDVLSGADMTHFDQTIPKAVDGAAGGAYSPTAPIDIGGANGMRFYGPIAVKSGAAFAIDAGATATIAAPVSHSAGETWLSGGSIALNSGALLNVASGAIVQTTAGATVTLEANETRLAAHTGTWQSGAKAYFDAGAKAIWQHGGALYVRDGGAVDRVVVSFGSAMGTLGINTSNHYSALNMSAASTMNLTIGGTAIAQITSTAIKPGVPIGRAVRVVSVGLTTVNVAANDDVVIVDCAGMLNSDTRAVVLPDHATAYVGQTHTVGKRYGGAGTGTLAISGYGGSPPYIWLPSGQATLLPIGYGGTTPCIYTFMWDGTGWAVIGSN